LLSDYQLADRLVTCAEFLEFIQDGGYQTPTLWLSLGWHAVQQGGWRAPLYWTNCDEQWHEFTLHGLVPIEPSAPVCHVSYFEADAFARWAACRLPTEYEWELAASSQPIVGNFAERRLLQPVAAGAVAGDASVPADNATDCPIPRQLFGDVWEWTSSAYSPYPGYRVTAGALG
ncbi:MAG: SUMF1/EgtB/PvdO family nonheme iron enzyme, partial [Calditrichaeota bacterium]|nr:SUMF1/EgtB/PvdO family nonheme iron enzyme [Calditrichota bacterium]